MSDIYTFTEKIVILKTYEISTHSEWVMRNSLYWISAFATWDLTKDDSNWIVQINSDDESIYIEFGRLLNDYLLRELISVKTDKLRERIAISVLTSIENRLNE